MKKTILTILLTLTCSNAFGMQKNNGRPNTQKAQAQMQSNLKKDLVKGLAGLASAFSFGYLSYKFATNCETLEQETPESINKEDPEYYVDSIEKVHLRIVEYIDKKLNLKPFEKRTHFYIRFFPLPIITAILAFKSAKYSGKKFASIIAAKTPENVKQKISSLYSMIAKKTQAYVKQPFSWIGNRLKLKNNNKID